MLKTSKFADLHTHIPSSDIEESLAMFQELIDLGVKDFNIASITYLGYSVDTNLLSLYCKEKIKEAKVSVFGGLYYSPTINHFGISFLQQAERLLEMGCDGFKFIENKPNYRKHNGFGINSKIYDDMFDMLEEKQVPLLCHVNDPEDFWHPEIIATWPNGQYILDHGWCYHTPDYLTHQEIYDEVLARLNKNPKLNIVFAHFMFISEKIEFAEKLMETYPNLKFDLTPGWEMYVGFAKNYERWHAFFEKYSHRILYGTDTHFYPMNKKIHETVRYAIGGESTEIVMPHVEHAKMRGFDLSQEAQENIAYKNYMRLIGGEPKPVNKKLMAEEAAWMMQRVQNSETEKECLARLERIVAEFS